MKRILRIAASGTIVGSVLAVVLAASALASPGWSAPVTFPFQVASPVISGPHIAYQKGGIATVAYVRLTSSTPPYASVLEIGTIAPGGSFRDELKILSKGSTLPSSVSLSVAPNGAAVAGWEVLPHGVGSAYEEYASYRPAGSRKWGKATKVATDASYNTNFPTNVTTAISSGGTAAVAIDHIDSTIPSPYGEKINIAVHTPTGGWGAATDVSPVSVDAEDPSMAFDAFGDLTVAFREAIPNGRYTLGVVQRPASNGVWGSFEDITGSDPTSDAQGPVLGVAPDGSAVIAFQYVHYAPQKLDVNAVTRSGADGTWSSPVDLTPGAASSGPIAAGVSPNNKAYVLYSLQADDSGNDCVGVVRASVGGSFTDPGCVSPLGFQADFQGGLSFLGNNAYFGWSGTPQTTSKLVPQASRWPNSAAGPDSFTDLDSPAAGSSIKAFIPDQDGSVVAIWGSATLKAAAYDAGGPNLVSDKLPAKATAGKKIKLTAKFVDLWSSPVKLSWNFGDKSKASTGAAVTHTYKKAGTFTVTVTATDELGNKTTKKFKIKVAKKHG